MTAWGSGVVVFASVVMSTASTIQVTAEPGRVSIVAVDAPLDAVVRSVAEKTGVFVAVDDSLVGERCSVELHGLPLDLALRKIAAPHDAFFFFDAESAEPASLRSVWIYRRGSGRRLRPMTADAGSAMELQQQLADADPHLRSAALEAVVQRGGARAVAAIATALRDDDDAVRLRALELALASEASMTGADLASFVGHDRSPEIRLLALQSLERRPEAREAAEVAKQDVDAHVRVEASAMLRRLSAAERSKQH